MLVQTKSLLFNLVSITLESARSWLALSTDCLDRRLTETAAVQPAAQQSIYQNQNTQIPLFVNVNQFFL